MPARNLCCNALQMWRDLWIISQLMRHVHISVNQTLLRHFGRLLMTACPLAELALHALLEAGHWQHLLAMASHGSLRYCWRLHRKTGGIVNDLLAELIARGKLFPKEEAMCQTSVSAFRPGLPLRRGGKDELCSFCHVQLRRRGYMPGCQWQSLFFEFFSDTFLWRQHASQSAWSRCARRLRTTTGAAVVIRPSMCGPVQASRMPDHLENMRKEVAQHDRASFFKLHNLAGDR